MGIIMIQGFAKKWDLVLPIHEEERMVVDAWTDGYHVGRYFTEKAKLNGLHYFTSTYNQSK